MKPTRLFPLLPALSALALLATPATGWADRKITVYRDNDHDGHFNKKKIEIPNRYYSHSYGPRYYSRSPSYYGGYGYGGYGYPSYGPSVSLSFQRSYSPSYRSDYSDDLAVDVQRELRRRGYYRGAIDGDIGPGSRAAIRAYQYDRGLSATGRIDSNLLRALGIG